jgi:hypothetical protein
VAECNNDTPAEKAERWAPVPGWPGCEVSDRGRVRRASDGALVRQFVRSSGYLAVHVPGETTSNLPRRQFVHRLVLEAFVGPRGPGQVTRHINGNPKDNRVENLAWGSEKENNADRRRHGRMPDGERSPNAKLTEAAVRAIRRMPEDVSNADIAAIAGVNRSIISQVRRGLRWAHVLSSSPDTAALPPSTKDADRLTSFTAPMDAPCAPGKDAESAPSEEERRAS